MWASTSTKNPSYPDTLYVDDLIGKNTVNTMPDETIEAFGDHGELKKDAIETNIDEAQNQMNKLNDLGISFDEITDRLTKEGVDKFIASYNELIDEIKNKANNFK